MFPPDDARLRHLRRQIDEGDAAAWSALSELGASMAAHGRDRASPVREVFAMLGDRWSMLILLVLRAGAWRHANLRRIVSSLSDEGSLSQRVLTQKLRAMERDGLVARAVTMDVPPRVSYRLTECGVSLVAQATAVLSWLKGHHGEIEAARAAFDARER